MPSQLKRYQQARQLHYITFTCYHRHKYMETDSARDVVEQALERVRRWYGFYTGRAGLGGKTRGLEVEHLSALFDGDRRRSGDRIAMDGT